METYRCFTRTWWKHNPTWPNGLEPKAGKKTYHEEFYSEQDARNYCRQWNQTNDPGKLSRKMEYEIV